jgi:site-specific DNA-cytosine methylase
MQSNPHAWNLTDLKSVKQNGIKVMSTFACGGGSSMGYKRAGCEVKRLGSFPDDYSTKTDEIGKYMIGMSVPPKMTEQVAKAVCSQWLGVDYGANP